MNAESPLFDRFHFGNSSSPIRLLITAGVHGDEFEPVLAIRQLMLFLKQYPAERLNGGITLVPIVNRSAFERADRCGEDGLDLARVCPGHPAGSLTQRVAAQLSRLIEESTHYVDLHGGGSVYHIHPLAGYMLHPTESVVGEQRRMAQAFGHPLVWGTSPSLNGRSLSVARDAGIPAIYVENGGGEFKSELLDGYVLGCRRVIHELGILEEASVPTEGAQYLLEEPAEDSGHLQVMMPSPAAGFFLSRVEPGEWVRKGQVWGELWSPESPVTTPVLADQDGLALLVRAVPSVKKGDSLGGILSSEAMVNMKES